MVYDMEIYDNDFPFAGAVYHHSPENGEPQGVHLHGDHWLSR